MSEYQLSFKEMPVVIEDDQIRIERLRLGAYDTNAYILVCRQTRESVLVDAPAEAQKIVESLAGTTLRYILLTHGHMDHTGALTELLARLRIPLAAHRADAGSLPSPPEVWLSDGDTVSLGKLKIEVRHTPGHTPGSLCFRCGRYLLSGDSIFPGGPGNTRSPAALQQVIQSLAGKIFTLPDDTVVYPGHGESTVLKKEKAEFAVFSSRPHDPKLCGDVLWLSS